MKFQRTVNSSAWKRVVRDVGSEQFERLVGLLQAVSDLDAKTCEFYEQFLTESAMGDGAVTFPVKVKGGLFAIVPESRYSEFVEASQLPEGSVVSKSTVELFKGVIFAIFNLLNDDGWGKEDGVDSKYRDLLLDRIETYCEDVSHTCPRETNMEAVFRSQTDVVVRNIGEVSEGFASRLGSFIVRVVNPRDKKKIMNKSDYASLSHMVQELNNWVMKDYCQGHPCIDLFEFNRLATLAESIDKNTLQTKNRQKVDHDFAAQFVETEPYILEYIDRYSPIDTVDEKDNGCVPDPTKLSNSLKDPNLIFNLIDDLQGLDINNADKQPMYAKASQDKYLFIPQLVRLASIYENWGFGAFRTCPSASPFIQLDTAALCHKVLLKNVPHNLNHHKKRKLWGRLLRSGYFAVEREGGKFHGTVRFGQRSVQVLLDKGPNRYTPTGHSSDPDRYPTSGSRVSRRIPSAKQVRYNPLAFIPNFESVISSDNIVAVDVNWKGLVFKNFDVMLLVQRLLGEGECTELRFWELVREVIAGGTNVTYTHNQQRNEDGSNKLEYSLNQLKQNNPAIKEAEDVLINLKVPTTNPELLRRNTRSRATHTSTLAQFYSRPDVQQLYWKRYHTRQSFFRRVANRLDDTYGEDTVYIFGQGTRTMDSTTQTWVNGLKREELDSLVLDKCRASYVCPICLRDVVVNIKDQHGRILKGVNGCPNRSCVGRNRACCNGPLCPPEGCPFGKCLSLSGYKHFNHGTLSASNILFITAFMAEHNDRPIMFHRSGKRNALHAPKTLAQNLFMLNPDSPDPFFSTNSSNSTPNLYYL